VSSFLLLFAAAIEPTPAPKPPRKIELLPLAARKIRPDFQGPFTCQALPWKTLPPLSGRLKDFLTHEVIVEGSGKRRR
jgi:hypothetical protein